jgi:hypothetical protein
MRLNQIFHYRKHKVLQVIEDLLSHPNLLDDNKPSIEYEHVKVMYQDLWKLINKNNEFTFVMRETMTNYLIRGITLSLSLSSTNFCR